MQKPNLLEDKPIINADENVWGIKLNKIIDKLQTFVNSIVDSVSGKLDKGNVSYNFDTAEKIENEIKNKVNQEDFDRNISDIEDKQRETDNFIQDFQNKTYVYHQNKELYDSQGKITDLIISNITVESLNGNSIGGSLSEEQIKTICSKYYEPKFDKKSGWNLDISSDENSNSESVIASTKLVYNIKENSINKDYLTKIPQQLSIDGNILKYKVEQGGRFIEKELNLPSSVTETWVNERFEPIIDEKKTGFNKDKSDDYSLGDSNTLVTTKATKNLSESLDKVIKDISISEGKLKYKEGLIGLSKELDLPSGSGGGSVPVNTMLYTSQQKMETSTGLPIKNINIESINDKKIEDLTKVEGLYTHKELVDLSDSNYEKFKDEISYFDTFDLKRVTRSKMINLSQSIFLSSGLDNGQCLRYLMMETRDESIKHISKYEEVMDFDFKSLEGLNLQENEIYIGEFDYYFYSQNGYPATISESKIYYKLNGNTGDKGNNYYNTFLIQSPVYSFIIKSQGEYKLVPLVDFLSVSKKYPSYRPNPIYEKLYSIFDKVLNGDNVKVIHRIKSNITCVGQTGNIAIYKLEGVGSNTSFESLGTKRVYLEVSGDSSEGTVDYKVVLPKLYVVRTSENTIGLVSPQQLYAYSDCNSMLYGSEPYVLREQNYVRMKKTSLLENIFFVKNNKVYVNLEDKTYELNMTPVKFPKENWSISLYHDGLQGSVYFSNIKYHNVGFFSGWYTVYNPKMNFKESGGQIDFLSIYDSSNKSTYGVGYISSIIFTYEDNTEYKLSIIPKLVSNGVSLISYLKKENHYTNIQEYYKIKTIYTLPFTQTYNFNMKENLYQNAIGFNLSNKMNVFKHFKPYFPRLNEWWNGNNNCIGVQGNKQVMLDSTIKDLANYFRPLNFKDMDLHINYLDLNKFMSLFQSITEQTYNTETRDYI